MNRLLAKVAEAYEYREQPFTLSSGQQSHHYLDCRTALSDPDVLGLAGLAIHRRIPLTVAAVGGLTFGADPLAIATSSYSHHRGGVKVAWFSVRKEPKGHGTGKRIEGYCRPGESVVVLEDVSTTGESAKKAVVACVQAGLKVERVLVFVDRGGVEGLNAWLGTDTEVDSVLSFEDVMLVGRARQVAIKAHAGQVYGRSLNPSSLGVGPFTEVHLPRVVNVLCEMLNGFEPKLLAAAWLHDVLEDTEETMDSLVRQDIPAFVRIVVDACTDGPGETRSERKQRPYELIPKTHNAILVKLADRIANVEHAKEHKHEKILSIYREEQPMFHERLKGSPVSQNEQVEAFWTRLHRALA